MPKSNLAGAGVHDAQLVGDSLPVARPDKPAAPPPAILATGCKSSIQLREDLAALDDEREQNATRFLEMEAGRNAVLLTDDDAEAEAHDAEMQRVRRAIERLDFKRPALVQAVAQAEEREAAEARARQQAEAQTEVERILARLAKEYEAPAGIIAAFLADWKRVDDLATAAGIDGPDRVARQRDPAIIEPEREERYAVYFDEQGRETDAPYSPGMSLTGPDGAPDRQPRRREMRTRTRPAQHDSGVYLGCLANRTNLPPARVGRPAPWEGCDLILKADDRPHVRRIF
ncbi:hypothetical protein C0214_13725 [Methylobacterium sp. DM1]|nr:hypothetical protein C0214_13725 [Methylobacterium sp. DM1]